MDINVELPTIKASEIMDKAAHFARDLVRNLDALNQQYPTAEMSPEEQEALKKTSDDQVLVPVPKQFTQVFERLFLAYMASRFVVIRD